MAYKAPVPQNKTALTPQEKKSLDFKNTINTPAMVKRVTTACGTKEKAGQFMASMLDLYESDSYLQNCDMNKIVAECLKAASLNLPLVKGLGFAYVVPFKNKGVLTPTFIIGYKGYIQLAMRSGQYKTINADAIYEGEEIIFDRLSGSIEIVGQKQSDKAIGYFAYFRLINGFEKTFYMSIDDIIAYGKTYSKTYNNGPWQTNFDEMAKKTVLRKIFKYGPMSAEMQAAEAEEIKSTEQRAQAEINDNANREIIDISDELTPPEMQEEPPEEIVYAQPPVDDGYDNEEDFPSEPPF